MPFDRFMIAPPQGGLQTNLKPWLIPDNAFAQLNNAYVFRGRVRKRFGSYLMNTSVNRSVAQLYSRLRIKVGTTNGSTGNLASTVMPGNVWAVGQQFSVGTTIFTVNQVNGATNSTSGSTAIYNTANGRLVITGNGLNLATDVYFYPATPVMGLISYETDVINDEPLYAFDTQFAYYYTGGAMGGWERLDPTFTWSGTDANFFWGKTYRGITAADQYLFVTNNVIEDNMSYWDGAEFQLLRPIVSPTTRIYTALLIIPFKGSLLILNTTEADEGILVGNTIGNGNLGTIAVPGGTLWAIGQNFTVGSSIFTITDDTVGVHNLDTNTTSTAVLTITSTTAGTLAITGNGINANMPVYFMPGTGGAPRNFFSRCRYSWDGSPTDVSAFQENVAGHGGYIDADTSEQIITCEFVKDRLIVYFERSTQEIVYTGNSAAPFVWQKINTELGSESTFSVIPFDKVALAIGNVGIHACNGSNVQRIDEKIPDEVFEISNDNEGANRVYGIRDYFTEMVYWAFPSLNINNIYPNRVLAYNYRQGTWSINDDSITCFGYFQDQNDFTWAASPQTWAESNFTWDDASERSKFNQVIAGNQQGFVFIIDPETSRNAPALQITSAFIGGTGVVMSLGIYNHNLVNNDYIALENLNGITGINYPNNIFQVSYVDENFVQIFFERGPAGTYEGGGTATRVSQIDILTKQYNFYVDEGRNAYIQKVDFLVDKTAQGQITVDTYVSSTELSQIDEGTATGAIMGTGILETTPYALVPIERVQTRLWHPIYPQAEGECVQLHIYLSDTQMRNPLIAWDNFELHAMTFYTSPTSSRLQ